MTEIAIFLQQKDDDCNNRKTYGTIFGTNHSDTQIASPLNKFFWFCNMRCMVLQTWGSIMQQKPRPKLFLMIKSKLIQAIKASKATIEAMKQW